MMAGANSEISSGSSLTLSGQYRLRRRLGTGRMAEVFSAVHAGAAGFERPVCVKRILPAHAGDEEFRRLFLREIGIAGELSHSNIVQVFDCVQHGPTLAIIMELVDGMNLLELTQRLARANRKLSEGLVAYVAGQTLAGLVYAHGRGLIHRDISPHNVLVSRQGEVKLTDFGVAKVMHTMGAATDDFRGKLPYMSPEQVRNAGVDSRSDLYSAGLVFYELLYGERFFNGPGLDMVGQIASARRPQLTGRSPELAALIEGLLEPDVDQRFPSAEAALEALPDWGEVSPAGAVALGQIVDELMPVPVAGESIPPGSPDLGPSEGQNDTLRGNTVRLDSDLGPRWDRPVVPAPPHAETTDREDDVQRALELAPTDEHETFDDRRTWERLPEAASGLHHALPPELSQTTGADRRAMPSLLRKILLIAAVFLLLAAGIAAGWMLTFLP